MGNKINRSGVPDKALNKYLTNHFQSEKILKLQEAKVELSFKVLLSSFTHLFAFFVCKILIDGFPIFNLGIIYINEDPSVEILQRFEIDFETHLMRCLVDAFEVILGASWIRNHCLIVVLRVPVCWANLKKLIG